MNRALNTLDGGKVVRYIIKVKGRRNSREGEKLQGVTSVHGVQCHSKLEDAGDIMSAMRNICMGGTYWAKAKTERKTCIFFDAVARSADCDDCAGCNLFAS